MPEKFRLSFAPAPSSPPLSADQSAVLAASPPVLVNGGPGTGKTGLVPQLARAAVAGGLRLEQILVLTSSRSAAQRLREATIRCLGGAHVAPQVTTVHGFCRSLLQRHADVDFRLLRAPEQEFRLRELLQSHDTSDWPPELAAAAGTRVFASQLRAVLARARQLGLDPSDLVDFATSDPTWGVVGRFFEEYLTVLDFEQAIDYAELVHRARLALRLPGVQSALDVHLVIADELAEHDPSQLDLLADVARDSFIGLADSQQSIFGFRGAHAAVREWFQTRYPHGRVFELRANHRSGEAIVTALNQVRSRLSAKGAPPPTQHVAGSATVRSVIYDNHASELSHVADALRQAHLRDGVEWGRCAVIARSGRHELTPIARTLRRFGVPVEVAGDEIALPEQQAVRTLLLGLRAALSESIDPDSAVLLLTSPLARFTSIEMRDLGRELRQRAREVGEPLRPASELIAELLNDPEPLADSEVTERATAFAQLLRQVARGIAAGESVHQLLWRLWSGTPWAEQLSREAIDEGDLRANEDLDAVVELFELAGRNSTLLGERGVRAFLSEVIGQVIPADTGRESDPRGRGVRVLTAHRAKGEEFDRVWIVGVQEGNWPKLRRYPGLLDPDALPPDVPHVPEPGVGNERRLFYVACARAREQLVVSGARGVEGEGDRPSRFLNELGVEVERVSGQAPSPLSFPQLVGELRRASTEAQHEPALRRAAATRLARLATMTGDNNRPLAAQADPARWWGVLPLSGRDLDSPDILRITATEISEVLECPRRWFLGRRASAGQHRDAAASVGSLVHALAQHALEQDVSLEQLSQHLDQVWEDIPFQAAWLKESERAEVEAALERLVAWREVDGREPLGLEAKFKVTLPIGAQPVSLEGTVDRLSQDSTGQLHIVDFKTGRSVPTVQAVADNDQLGAYQLAASLGAFNELTDSRELGGAELVFLRVQAGSQPFPKVMRQPSLTQTPRPTETEPTWVHSRLRAAVEVIGSGNYPAIQCASCRFCAFQRNCPAITRHPEVVS